MHHKFLFLIFIFSYFSSHAMLAPKSIAELQSAIPESQLSEEQVKSFAQKMCDKALEEDDAAAVFSIARLLKPPLASAWLTELLETEQGMETATKELTTAIEDNDQPTAEFLLSTGNVQLANANLFYAFSLPVSVSLLYRCIEGNKLKIASALLRSGADPDKVGYHGFTPLLFTACMHTAATVRAAHLLLTQGADPNKRGTKRQSHDSPLIECLQNSFPAGGAPFVPTFAMVELLLDSGADRTEKSVGSVNQILSEPY